MKDWNMVGKPALVLLHYQEGIIGKGTWIQGWYEPAKKACIEAGMFEHTKELLDAFRAKGLPVVFVNALANPFGKLPAYGYLFDKNREHFNSAPLVENTELADGLAVMPEMERRPDEPVLYNWLLAGFTNSGLDAVLRAANVETIVLCGFALNSVVYHTAVQAGDLWYNTIIPSDTSAVYMPRKPGEKPDIDEVVTGVVLEEMAPSLSLVTTAADVIAHLPDQA
ncbi:MAG: cysteine hydrolase [Oscillospiraceae bacterium]|nr:cysteine hydrolase [Oscillospiraceae bacterium]